MTVYAFQDLGFEKAEIHLVKSGSRRTLANIADAQGGLNPPPDRSTSHGNPNQYLLVPTAVEDGGPLAQDAYEQRESLESVCDPTCRRELSHPGRLLQQLGCAARALHLAQPLSCTGLTAVLQTSQRIHLGTSSGSALACVLRS